MHLHVESTCKCISVEAGGAKEESVTLAGCLLRASFLTHNREDLVFTGLVGQKQIFSHFAPGEEGLYEMLNFTI